MRGKVTVSSSSRVMIGITPAYAGKSVATLYSLVKVQDHPRLCGEKGKPGVLVTEEQGSPPPMRGKAALSGYDCTAGGITPAYAGKSFVLRSYRPCWRDHPRLCGEKVTFPQQLISHKGSPPPMRGKVRRLHSVLARFGITPAYAGKSASTRSADRCMQDHPRLCGEKAGGVKMEIDVKGSPPPMRGKDFHLTLWYQIPGITPAYAGKRFVCDF